MTRGPIRDEETEAAILSQAGEWGGEAMSDHQKGREAYRAGVEFAERHSSQWEAGWMSAQEDNYAPFEDRPDGWDD